MLNDTIRSLNQSYLTLRDVVEQIPSCAALLQLYPSFTSGYYLIRSSNGSPVRVYCDMTLSCGGVTGGWMRVAELDMTDDSNQCPESLIERGDSNIRTCGIPSSSPSCSQVPIPLSHVTYDRVCGKIRAYQYGSTDAFSVSSVNISTYYVDGVSLTYGGPKTRQHIWTFAAALDEVGTYPRENCPCTNTNSTDFTPPPAFVGNDYFCDTGSESRFQHNIFYGDDPLWDGAGCGPLNTCCTFNNPPWFHKELPEPTTDDIEMRVCKNNVEEDIAIEMVSIYVI